MSYLTKSVETIGQIIGAVWGAGFTAPTETTLKITGYLGIF